jgi:hypothetical protein
LGAAPAASSVRIAGLIALVAAVVSTSSVANGAIRTRSLPGAGPVLAGSHVVWADDHRGGGVNLKSAAPGGRPARMATLDPPRYSELIPELGASRARVAIGTGISSPDALWGQRSVFSATIGSRPRQLGSRCNLSDLADLPRAVDVSGEAIIYPRCDSDGQFVHVRDYSTTPPVDRRIADAIPGGGLRIAGRYVAWLEPSGHNVFNKSGVTVYDRVLGAPIYVIGKQAVGYGLHQLDLQSDGTLVFSYASDNRHRIAWASLSEPYRHVLPLHAREPYEVRIADDQIAFETGSQPGAGIVARAKVGVSDLAGHARILGNQGEGSLFSEDFDFDGHRLAWWSYGCANVRIHVVDATASPRVSSPRQGCRLRLTRQPRLENEGRRLRLFVDCFGFDINGHNRCGVRKARVTTEHDGETTLVAMKQRGSSVKLTDKGRELVRRPGELHVRVAATLVDLADRRERRHTQASIGD